MSDSKDPNPPSEPQDEGVSEHSERDAALAAVLREQIEKEKIEALARRVRLRRRRVGIRHLALGFAAATTMWIWMWPPSVLEITPATPPPLLQEETTLRLVMYLQAQQIEQYRLGSGRVPTALDDAGPPFPGIEYVRLTDTDYRILGRTRRITLSYSSVEPLDTFVGTAAAILGPLVFDE